MSICTEMLSILSSGSDMNTVDLVLQTSAAPSPDWRRAAHRDVNRMVGAGLLRYTSGEWEPARVQITPKGAARIAA